MYKDFKRDIRRHPINYDFIPFTYKPPGTIATVAKTILR